jgi:hypothetical protein
MKKPQQRQARVMMIADVFNATSLFRAPTDCDSEKSYPHNLALFLQAED